MTTVIEKLKVKGAPVPTNSPTSSLLATSRANRPIPNTIIALDKSYEFILKQANKQPWELGSNHLSAANRRLEYLSRLQHANFGISTMDSSFIVSEDVITDERPSFVLCGQPVSGVSDKTIQKYLSDQRTGNYKTSAQEMYRVRHNIKTTKARSEPHLRHAEYESKALLEVKQEFADNVSLGSGGQTVPSSAALSISSRKPLTEPHHNKSPFELTGRSFKRKNGSVDKWNIYNNPGSHLRLNTPKSSKKVYRKDSTGKQRNIQNTEEQNLTKCLQVNHRNVGSSPTITPRTPSKVSHSYVQKGIKLINNPYRHLKHRENVLLTDRKVDMKSVKKITSMSKAPLILPNGKRLDIPKNILKVPNPCSDTFLLQMLFTVNNPKSFNKSTGGTYSDIALHNDLDEYMVVRSPSSQSKLPPGSPMKLAAQKSAKSGKSNLDEVDEDGAWAGNEVQEEQLDLKA